MIERVVVTDTPSGWVHLLGSGESRMMKLMSRSTRGDGTEQGFAVGIEDELLASVRRRLWQLLSLLMESVSRLGHVMWLEVGHGAMLGGQRRSEKCLIIRHGLGCGCGGRISRTAG